MSYSKDVSDYQEKYDDAELMQGFQNGDEDAFNEIVIKYDKPLVNFIYRYTGNHAVAEELAQDVFVKVYKSAGRYKPTAKFSTWLYSIAANVCLDYKRKKIPYTISLDSKIKTEEDEIAKEIKDTGQLSSDIISEKTELSRSVNTALNTLPEKQRLALILKVYEDKSYKEIAEILNCSAPAVESLLSRARSSLKKHLDKSMQYV
jgi:RNA polymerase sigma-70 factor (ECF subfamily)